jgi:lysophospholipase L1-like esterase
VIDPAIMPDLLHLSAKGYAIWADAIEADLKKVLEEK